MMCIECGNTVYGRGEVCEDCMDVVGVAGNLSLQSAANAIRCARCEGQILSTQLNTRMCINCNKYLHINCDPSENTLEGFVCVSCRQSPLVGDVMFSVPESPLAEESRESANEALAGPSLALSGVSSMAPFITSVGGSSSIVPQHSASMNDFSEIYQLSEEINSPATTSDSARNSPFYTENSPSDVDEDFVPGSTRGSGRGRGGAKKKPTRGAPFLKIRSSVIPSTGMYTAEQLNAITTATTRGKRGKRGAGSTNKGPGKGPGRGRGRGRGSASQLTQSISMQQLVCPTQSLPIVREVDESIVDDEPSRHSSARLDDESVKTSVVYDAADEFLQTACLCLVCGSVGKGVENSMVMCSNCAQTFHTYCVGLHDKLNSTVVFRGWRCLDCTVCEGCGEGKDESKLLLCEECDVAYHIYCLKPPLERIPNGPWRCQWCARCRRCGLKVSLGTELTREGLCTPCNTLKKCLKCSKTYNIGDKIIRCSTCSRWFHGICEGLYNDEMLEQAATNKMRCSSCRPNRGISSSAGPGDNSSVVLCDNVMLNKAAEEVLKSKFMPSLCRPSHLDGYGYRESIDHYGSVDDEYTDDYDYYGSTRGRGMTRGAGPGRRITKLGVGGFYVKIPRHRMLAFVEEAAASNAPDDDENKRQKRPRKPRRSQLEDAYPPAIQEGFFGIKPVEGKALVDLTIEEPLLAEYGNGKTLQSDSTGHELSTEATEILRNDMNEVDILENMDLHEVESDIEKMDLSILFLDGEDDDDFDDSFNDLIKTEGSREVDLNDIKPTVDGFGAPDFNQSGEGPGFSGTPALHPKAQNAASQLAGSVASRANAASRSSSQSDAPGRNSAATERWEEDEPLGLKATTAPMLYANEKHAKLKEDHPEWQDRVRQIQRLWRNLGAEERLEYVNRARENRTNRGKQPRPRKVQAHSTTSVDSPTPHSPSPAFFQRSGGPDDRFKVPAIPSDSGLQQPPQPTVRVTMHLTPELQTSYRQMLDRKMDLEKIVNVTESELNKQRKTKKNLAAKKRQMIKTATMAPDYDGRLIDLCEVDKLQFQQLTDNIPAQQKELENSRRDLKIHEAVVKEFEQKHQILRPACEVSPALLQAQVQMDPIRLQMLRQQQQMIGVPPQHMQMQQRLPPGAAPPPMQQMRVPQQIPYGMMMHHPSQHDVHRQMQQQRARVARAPILGGVLFERVQNPMEREVYECLDDIIYEISLRVDGRDPARENMGGMLKRLLDPGPAGMLPASQHPGLMEQLEGPRPKKKRTQPKKTAQSMGSASEYDTWVEKMRTRFRLCPKIPRKAKEPPFRNSGPLFATMGITELAFKPDRKPLTGDGFGKMHLSYTDDYYTGEDRLSRVLQFSLISMVDVAPQANIIALQNVVMPPEPELIADECDSRMGMSTTWNILPLVLDRKPPLEHIRTISKVTDNSPLIEPHRRLFYEPPPEKPEVEVTVLMDKEPKTETRGVDQMMQKLRDILGVTKEIEVQVDTPPLSPTAIKQEVEDAAPEVSMSVSSSSGSSKGKPQRCKMCNVVIEEKTSPIRQKLSRLGISHDSDEDDVVFFCTMRCYCQLMATSKVPLSNDELVAAEGQVDEATLAKLRQINAENFAKNINQGKKMSVAPALHLDGMLSPRDTRYMMDEGRKEHVTIINVSELTSMQEVVPKAEIAKKLGDDWKVYSKEIAQSFIKIQAMQQEYVQSSKMGIQTPSYELDKRLCVLCGRQGDGETSTCGRLLSLTESFWVHVNCALWSTEVFENQSGALINVDSAVIRASKQQCCICGRNGASIKCHKMDCNKSFHLVCAKSIGGYFVRDRTFICRAHEGVAAEATVQKLDALRRIYIQRDENALLSKLFELTDGPKLCLRLGSFAFFAVGQILPEQLKTFHNANFIFPVGYSVTRWFWSPRDPRVRVLFECTIRDVDKRPQFVVKEANSDCCFTGGTASDAWMPVLSAVEKSRQTIDVLRFFPKAVQGETLFGLNESVISKITESLPGIDTLFTYTFRHQNSPLLDLPLAENPSGCARGEPRFRTHIKQHRQQRPGRTEKAMMKSSNEGRSRNQRGSYADEATQRLKSMGYSSEMAAMYAKGIEPMQSSQLNFTAYQKMRREWKQTVYLARSKIQGLGLYANRDIAMGDFIIEYKGEVIRAEVGEVREKRYTAQNRGVYMFRIDDELFIDATMAGGPARYINHSCDPNCSTRILEYGATAEEKKIIITANRPIKDEEELTYDYQFELEDATDKIPCLCGAPNCVKWMN